MATKTKPKTTVEIQIVDYLKENGIKMSWLADQIPCSVGHLHLVLKGKPEKTKRPLTPENLKKINQVLNTKF